MLECSNNQCNEVVSSSGTGSVGNIEFVDDYGQLAQTYDEYFLPTSFEPFLNLIAIPGECRASVAIPLEESFKLFFSSSSAASNCVRIAIEELMTDLKVRRFVVIKGKRKPVSLHQRINLLPPKYGHLKEMIRAIKWLGNAGSHSTLNITPDDVLDAYDLTEHILQEIYEPKVKKLSALAKKVNKKKGPAN